MSVSFAARIAAASRRKVRHLSRSLATTQAGNGAHQPENGAPHPGDGAPHPGDGAPRPGDGAPRPGDGAPWPGDGAPWPEDGAPWPGDDMKPPVFPLDDEPVRGRPKKDPSERSVLLFPGQGSQFVGMCRGLLQYPNVKEMFAAAQEILGYDLLSLCLHGPEEDLLKTVHCQPAVFVTSLAAVEKLNEENPQAVQSCAAAAGFSVGEFAALVFSGAMNFAEALYAVKVRAEAMQKASELVPSGMLSVIGKPQASYKHACLQAKEHCASLGIQDPVCSVANYLFPDGRVIAGHRQALDFLQQNSRRLQFVRTKLLPVSGAFHTRLMQSATEPLREVLQQVEVRRPMIRVYSNVDGKRYMSEKHVRRQLVKQLVLPVKWEQTLHEVYEREQGKKFPHTYEVGPGKQLGSMLHKCNRKAYNTYSHVEVVNYD